MRRLLVILPILLVMLAGCATGGTRTLDGTPVTNLDEVTDERAIVVIFWSLTCPACEQLLIEAERLDVEVVAINVGGKAAAVYEYMTSHRFHFIPLVGGVSPVNGVPHTRIMVRESVGWITLYEFTGYVPGQLSKVVMLLP